MTTLLTLLLMAPPPGQGGGGMGALLANLIPIILIFVVFYFFMIRPQQKKAKEREALLSSITKGDKVVTAGGAHGVVESVEDQIVVVRLVPANLAIKFDKSSISQVIRAKEIDEKK